MNFFVQEFMTTEVRRTLTDRVLERREELGLSQTELARRLEVSQGHLADIESGRRGTSLELLSKLSDVLKVSVDWLLGKTNNMDPYGDLEDQVVKLVPDAKKRQVMQGMVEVVAEMDTRDLNLIVSLADRLSQPGVQKKSVRRGAQDPAALATNEQTVEEWLDLIEEIGGAELRAEAMRKHGLKTAAASDRSATL